MVFCFLQHIPFLYVFYIPLLIFFAAGCRSRVIPPAPAPVDISHLDTGCLTDRVIVIDPGHGGPERGAIGRQGLSEAEVNLGVALTLWGLLHEAGARPVLTRKTDTSVFNGPEFDLKKDLEARSRISNARDADLFISIHHNAASHKTDRNDLLIFYKMTDSGQSRDVAREVCAALGESLGNGKGRIAAAHYHVLRNTEAPAILGEASFMSNHDNEAMLSHYRTLRKEAAGYFYGILSYYRKGVPGVVNAAPHQVTVTSLRPEIRLKLDPGIDNASVDAASVRITFDGTPVSRFDASDNGSVRFTPLQELSNAVHTYCISARNSRGNSSENWCGSFAVSLPPASITATAAFPVIPPDGMSHTPIDIAVADARGRPVIDRTPVRLSASAGTLLDDTVLTRDGSAHAVLTSQEHKANSLVTVEAGSARSRLRVRFDTPEHALTVITLRDSTGAPVAGARLLCNGCEVSRSNDYGFLYHAFESGQPADCKIVKQGFFPVGFTPTIIKGDCSIHNFSLSPVAGGIFFGRTIALDADGLLDNSAQVLKRLAEKISFAGAHAVFTRQEAPASGKKGRVMKANAANADIFISVAAGARRPGIGYYYKSEAGHVLAHTIARHLNRMPQARRRSPLEPSPATRYLVIHTAMPAVVLSLPKQLSDDPEGAAESIYGALKEALAMLGGVE